MEGLKSSYAELEKKLAKSELTIADLRRQLEKWRTLESREGAEMDTLRRGRIELEVRVKELEGRVEELEDEAAVKDEYAEKQKAKVTQYKTTLEDYKTSLDKFRVRSDCGLLCRCLTKDMLIHCRKHLRKPAQMQTTRRGMPQTCGNAWRKRKQP